MKDFIFVVIHAVILVVFYLIFKPIETNLGFGICILAGITHILGFIKGKIDD